MTYDQRIAKGTLLRYIGRDGEGQGTLATYDGGADYVPGLDAGNFTVTFVDGPQDWFYGHRGMSHWTYDELMATWEVVEAARGLLQVSVRILTGTARPGSAQIVYEAEWNEGATREQHRDALAWFVRHAGIEGDVALDAIPDGDDWYAVMVTAPAAVAAAH